MFVGREQQDADGAVRAAVAQVQRCHAWLPQIRIPRPTGATMPHLNPICDGLLTEYVIMFWAYGCFQISSAGRARDGVAQRQGAAARRAGLISV